MEGPDAESVAVLLTSVSSYGGQLATVFHSYALIAEVVPCGLEGAVNILDATVATLKQVLTLLKDDVEISGLKDGGGRLLSEVSLKYVHLLALESARTLAKVEPTLDEACLGRKERKALLKKKKNTPPKKAASKLDPLSLRLDEERFLEILEKTKWSSATDNLEKDLDRLYELQLHLLLVYQVITVGALSRDVSSGNVDVTSIVTYHKRIHRTADLIGIKRLPRTTNFRNKYGRGNSFVSIDSFSSSSSSDSDSDTSIRKYRSRAPSPPLPPPPPANPPAVRGLPLPQTLRIDTPSSSSFLPVKDYPLPESRPPVIECSNPPAYSESHKSEDSSSDSSSTRLGTVTASSTVVPDPPSPKKTISTLFPNEKTGIQIESNTNGAVAETAPGPFLFQSKPTTLGFRFKSLFRSPELLAEEMRNTLNNSQMVLTAFIIQGAVNREVPHSAFHSLETTHMKTILSQLNDNTWYKTFTTLDSAEHSAIVRILHPMVNGKTHERELVVLKVLQQNKTNAWMALLSEMLRNQPFPRTKRVILAICRGKLVDGKQLPVTFSGSLARSPPMPMPMQMPIPPPIRHIKHPDIPNRPGPATRISDLKLPVPPQFPRGWNPPYQSGPPPRSPGPKPSIRISDTTPTTPMTDREARAALTNYIEYTIRLCSPAQAGGFRSWSRVVVTQESAERHLLELRVEQFEDRDGNIIDTKLRMTEQQSGQVSRIMDEVKAAERDYRFEWCWVEISLHNDNGEITDLVPRGPTDILSTATIIHLIAKRMVKSQYKALDIYNGLTRPPPPPQGPPPPHGPPPPPGPGPRPIVSPPPIALGAKSNRRAVSDTETDTDSTWSSDSSVGQVRRRLRRYKAKKAKKSGRKKFHSESDSESEAEEEDVIKVDVDLKRGDDLVAVLLALWTVAPGKGKGKMI